MLHRLCRTVIPTALLAAVAVSLSAQTAGPRPLSEFLDPQWAMDALWDDGRAEVATYEGERIIDGAPRRHILHLITVKQDFNREFNVKADWPHGQKPILPVLRQSQFATIETPNFPHHLSCSVFIERESPLSLVKLTVSSQDWMGLTHKEFNFGARTPRWTWSSYWDEEGSGTETLGGWPRGTVFEEQLPLLVRALDLREGVDAALALAPMQLTNRAARPEPVSARLRVERPEAEVRVPAGTWAAEDLWRVTVEAGDGRALEFVVVDESPRVPLAWSVNDGRFYVLRDVKRDAFWQIRD